VDPDDHHPLHLVLQWCYNGVTVVLQDPDDHHPLHLVLAVDYYVRFSKRQTILVLESNDSGVRE
jgi:hypothetical protein